MTRCWTMRLLRCAKSPYETLSGRETLRYARPSDLFSPTEGTPHSFSLTEAYCSPTRHRPCSWIACWTTTLPLCCSWNAAPRAITSLTNCRNHSPHFQVRMQRLMRVSSFCACLSSLMTNPCASRSVAVQDAPATAIEQRRLLLSLDVSGPVYSRPHICGSRGTILVDHHGEISVMRTTEHPTSARLPFLVLAGARGITLPNRNTVFMQW